MALFLLLQGFLFLFLFFFLTHPVLGAGSALTWLRGKLHAQKKKKKKKNLKKWQKFLGQAVLELLIQTIVCHFRSLKGLTMIFTGQENPFIIFRSKENIHMFQNKYQNPHKFAEIMKKNRVFGKFHSWGCF